MDKSSNQSDVQPDQIGVGEFHSHIAHSTVITMPNAGHKEHGDVHFDKPTRSDSNEGM